MATVENTNTTIIQMLDKAEKRAEKDKEDIQRWCTGRSPVPNEIVAIPPAVSLNATTTSQLSGSTQKSYFWRFLGWSNDLEQRQDIKSAHANKKQKSAPSTAETSMQSSISDNTKPTKDTVMQYDQSQLSVVDIQLLELRPTAEELKWYIARER